MEKYITDMEKQKCKKVADLYAELEEDGIVVLDVGKYGFVVLQYYKPPQGFDNVITFTDSTDLFNFLWNEWLDTQLIKLADELEIDIDSDDVFGHLPEKKQTELMEKREFFLEKAGFKDDSGST